MGQKTNPISNRIGITRGWDLYIRSVSGRSLEGQWSKNSLQLGITDAPQNGKALWRNNGNDYLPYNYYAAIVAERFD